MYKGFPRDLISAVRCPADGSSLSAASRETHIKNGDLKCRDCGETYEIRNGILLMVRRESLPQHLLDEMKARDAGASSYDSHLKGRYLREVAPTLDEIGEVAGKRIIEHGAGTGRFTELLSPKSGPYLAADISLESLYVLAGKGVRENVGLVCADGTTFCASRGYFDIALALQVIEHMPTTEIRERFFSLVKEGLTEGGKFVASVYHNDLRRIWARLPVDGVHADGVPFHFFTKEEFQSELSNTFSQVSVRPIDITLPFVTRLGVSNQMVGRLSRLSERLPLINKFGHLVIGKAIVLHQ